MHIAATAVGSNFAQADEGKRREHVQMTRDWIDHSVTLGAPCLRVFAGPVPEGHDEAQAFTWAVECLREVAAHGAERGVLLALENHGGITTTAKQVLRLLAAVNSDWLGLNLDFGNFKHADGMDPYQQFAACAPAAVSTHAKVHMRDEQRNPVPVDYARVNQIMHAAGYRGYVSIEYEDQPEANLAVPKFVEYLKSTMT